MKSNTMTMEAPSTEHSNPFFRFEVSRVCATCTKQLETGTYYSLDTLVDLTDNVNLIHVLVSLCQFKCEENGPSNICRDCFYKTSLFYEFHQQCKNSVMLFDKYVEWQKQFLKPDIVDLGIYDTDAISTNVEEEQDEKLTIDIEETVISEAMSTHVEEEQDVKLTIDIEETVISEGTLVNANDDFNSLRQVVGVESDMSCNSNESTKSNMLKEKSKQNKLYECTKCDATYDNPKLHERLHTGQLPYPCLVYICKLCDKRFLSNSLLTQHQLIHIQKRPFNSNSSSEDEEANQQTRESNMLEEKSKQDKLYKCTECDATFKQYSSFVLHQNIHKKRFVCSHCGKACQRQSALRIHERIHTGERPYVCGKCGKRFTTKGALKTHLATHTGKRIYIFNKPSKFLEGVGIKY